jgi:hypothetical protein
MSEKKLVTLSLTVILTLATANCSARADTASGITGNVDPNSAIADAVDLGLSVKWASWNVGAAKPEEYGGYFGWADVTGKKPRHRTMTTQAPIPRTISAAQSTTPPTRIGAYHGACQRVKNSRNSSIVQAGQKQS